MPIFVEPFCETPILKVLISVELVLMGLICREPASAMPICREQICGVLI